MVWSKPTISGNGGAVRYWTHAHNGSRLVLCRNGKRLLQARKRGNWQVTTLSLEDIAIDRSWRSDTAISASAAITRTGRLARRSA